MMLPEGWYRLAKEVIALRLLEKVTRPGDRVGALSGVGCGDMQHALIHMKNLTYTLYDLESYLQEMEQEKPGSTGGHWEVAKAAVMDLEVWK